MKIGGKVLVHDDDGTGSHGLALKTAVQGGASGFNKERVWTRANVHRFKPLLTTLCGGR